MAFEYPILDPFHKRLYKVLAEDLQNRVERLVAGGAFPSIEEAKLVSEKYAEAIGYIQALTTVLQVCRDIEVEMQGGKPDME